jgi:hypothetical protein
MIAEVDEPNACALAIEAGLVLCAIGLAPGNPTLDWGSEGCISKTLAFRASHKRDEKK